MLSIGLECEARGERPVEGLIVSNHLSYLDILAYASTMPCVFVAKSDVRSWPVFGFLARCGGTIFIDRGNRAGAAEVVQQIAEALKAGVAVLIFPEGTSTDGSVVLRFHPSLLEPAVQCGAPVRAAAVGYRLPGGNESDLCYYGDVRFVPHLLATLGRIGVTAQIEFHPDTVQYGDRKAAALDLQEKVEALRKRLRRPD